MRSLYSISIITVFLFCSDQKLNAQAHFIESPGDLSQFQITFDQEINYSVFYNGNRIIDNSKFSLQFNDLPLFGNDVEVIDIKKSEINNVWNPVAGSFSEIVNHYNELNITVKEKNIPRRELIIVVRAYDDGIAFRYTIPDTWEKFISSNSSDKRILLTEENVEFRFNSDKKVWATDYRLYASHQESEFEAQNLSDISPESLIGLPLLLNIDMTCYAAITEADLTDWAGMYLKKWDVNQPFNLKSDLSPLLKNKGGRVRVKPGSSSPWRVIMLGETPGDLIESEIINNLNDPCEIEDPSWIVPGISAWDHWWSGEIKMDTETIKEYIQLASDMGWDYMLIDWHWYDDPWINVGEKANPDVDITTVNPAVDMPQVIEYAKAKNVKLILWLLWDHVDKQMDEAFTLYENWGISGVKIDFMARDDQEMVNWYQKVVKKASEHHLLVDFHGAYKPTGWSRTYPNLITREGVLGNEYTKWSSRITPEHNVTLPFTRMLAGQMDYTPGAFLNVTRENFKPGSPARVMNTRAQQLAMFVVYFSPLTVACDHPDNYKGQPGIEFLKEVPTVWDDTKVLAGEIGEFIVMARKKGDRWYLGAMNNSISKEVDIKLDFLTVGEYTLYYFKDSPESDTYPDKIIVGQEKITGGQTYSIKMSIGGGYAGYIEEKL